MPMSQDVIPRVQEVLARKNDNCSGAAWLWRSWSVAARCFLSRQPFAVARMVGWLLILSASVTIWDAFTVEGTGPFFGELLIGLLKLAFGVYLFRHTRC